MPCDGHHGPRLRCRADATAERLGPEDLFALLALSRLAFVLVERCAFIEAEPLRRRILEARERLQCPEHYNTLAARPEHYDYNRLTAGLNLAFVLEKLGKLSEAPYLRRAAGSHHGGWLVLRFALGKRPSPSIGDLLRGLKNNSAEPLYRRSLAGLEAQVGAQHPDTLLSMNNFAELLRQQGKLEEAEPLYRRCLAGQEVMLGAQHPDTLLSMNNFAFFLKDQGKLLEAESLWRRCLEGEEAQRGPNHPDTLLQAMNLGVFLRDLGRLDDSDALLQRAVADFELGGRPLKLRSMHHLALLRVAQGRPGEAEPLFRRALEGLETEVGEGRQWALQTMSGLAKLLEAKGSLQEAEDLYLRELQSLEEVHGGDHEKTAESRRNWQRFQREHGASGSRPSAPISP
eukprot:s2666_g7.t1